MWGFFIPSKRSHKDFKINKAVTEQELQDKAVAPRVTKDRIDSLMGKVSYVVVQQPGDTTSTFVHAFLDGSFFLATGFSACVNKENFDADIGERLAKSQAEKNAQAKLWELEGYRLFDSASQPSTPQQRIHIERNELADKIDKLKGFLNKGQPTFIDDNQWYLLDMQQKTMWQYLNLLDERIKLM